MACPHVLGAVALHLENHPEARPEEVRWTIMAAAKNVRIGGLPSQTTNRMLNVADLPCKQVRLVSSGRERESKGIESLTWLIHSDDSASLLTTRLSSPSHLSQVQDCVAGPWGPWSACPTDTCGQRFSMRRREVRERQRCGGRPCILEETRPCGKGPDCPPWAVQRFESGAGFDSMEYKRIAFKPYATNAYSACSLLGEGLEESMEGNWIVLDTPGYIKAQVTFFGEMHQGVYVSSNGHITFGESDHTKNKGNWEEHWRKPRISVLFADLKPELKPGAVKYKFAEGNGEAKLVITWDHVPGESHHHSSPTSLPSPLSPLSLLSPLSTLSLSPLSLSWGVMDGWIFGKVC